MTGVQTCALPIFHETYRYQVIAAQYNLKDHLSFELINPPSWLKINSQGLISGFPPPLQDVFTVQIAVKDQSGNSAQQSYTIGVKKSAPVSTQWLWMLAMFVLLSVVLLVYIIPKMLNKKNIN